MTGPDPEPQAEPEPEHAARSIGRRPTIRDVAAAAGVSRGTVSRVLNNSTAVRPDTRRIVMEAITRTRFVASATARSLNTRRTGTVALVITERYERVFEDPSFSLMVRGLQLHTEQAGLLMFIVLAETEDSRARIVERAVSGSVDGLVLLSTHGDDPIFRLIVDADVPAVVCGEPLGTGDALPFVRLGDQAGARSAVEHLVETGCRSIAAVVGPPDTASSRNREAGAREGVCFGESAAELQVYRSAEYSVVEGARAMEQILDRASRPDAVFCASDVLAMGALAKCADANLKVPDDLRFATFDDTAFASRHVPPLTSVALPFDTCAGASIDLLIRMLDGERPRPAQLECTLHVRASSQPPAHRGRSMRSHGHSSDPRRSGLGEVSAG